MYSDVLLATHTGEERAVDHAIDVCREYGATLHVLYAVDPSTWSTLGGDVSTTVHELEEKGQETVDDVAARAGKEGVDVVTAVVDRVPHEAILEYARENDVDLIVMGASTYEGRLRSSLLGGATDKVVRTSRIPVLTVRDLPDE